MKLDDVFVKKDDIAIAVKTELNEAMMDYGYDIIKTLVTDIDPDAQVKEAMNRINASEREKIAAQFEGDAARILIVEKAKAEAESKRLQGQGIADQRREIARGLEESVEVLNKVGINSQEASALIVVTQHYDTLQSIGGESNSNLILLPNSPQAGSNMLNDMVASFTASNQIGEAMKNSKNKKKEDQPLFYVKASSRSKGLLSSEAFLINAFVSGLSFWPDLSSSFSTIITAIRVPTFLAAVPNKGDNSS